MNPEPPARPHGAGSLGFGERDNDATDASPLELEDVLTTILETAYRWDFASDRIDWAENATELTGQDWRYVKVMQREFEQLQPVVFSDCAFYATMQPGLFPE